MGVQDLVKSEKELMEVAEALSKNIQGFGENAIARYTRVIYDIASFVNGRIQIYNHSDANVNRELINRGIYSTTTIDDLFPHNFGEVTVAGTYKIIGFHF